jgi:colicin import membrane protein
MAAAAALELPQTLAAAIAAEIGRAAAQARAEIEGRLVEVQTEAADLAMTGESLEDERDSLIAQMAVLTTERDTLAAKRRSRLQTWLN